MANEIDFLNASGKGQGPVASKLLGMEKVDPAFMRPFIGDDGKPYVSIYKGGDPMDPKNYVEKLVTNATLRREEWMALDQAIIPVAESRLSGIMDLRSRGLVYKLANPLGTTVLEHHDISDAMEAELSMDGVTRAPGDRVDFGASYLPIPIIHVDYEIGQRALIASRALGNGLDTSSAERAARKVAEKLESMLFTNTTYRFGGGFIYSYLNHPDRNQRALALAWSDPAKTPAQILADVIALKQDSINHFHYGPWVIYIPTAYETVLDEDYDVAGASTQTIRERILKVAGISDIKVVDTLPADNILLVQMTSDVVRLVDGMGLQNIEWAQEGGMINKFKVMAIQVPQIRSDYNGESGIVHMA